MNCFDCSLDRRTTPALGTCTVCGAGVCAEHVELDAHEQAHTSGIRAQRIRSRQHGFVLLVIAAGRIRSA